MLPQRLPRVRPGGLQVRRATNIGVVHDVVAKASAGRVGMKCVHKHGALRRVCFELPLLMMRDLVCLRDVIAS